MADFNRNEIVRDGDTWYRMGGGFIRWSPEDSENSYGSAYIAARLGSPEFWCEDARDFVYSFASLVNGTGSAPRYMRTLAKRVRRDLSL